MGSFFIFTFFLREKEASISYRAKSVSPSKFKMNIKRALEILINNSFSELDLLLFLFPFVFLSIILYLVFRKVDYFSKKISIVLALIIAFLTTPLYLRLGLNSWLVLLILAFVVFLSYFKESKNKIVFIFSAIILFVLMYLIILTGVIRNMYFLGTETFAYMIIIVLCIILVKKYVINSKN